MFILALGIITAFIALPMHVLGAQADSAPSGRITVTLNMNLAGGTVEYTAADGTKIRAVPADGGYSINSQETASAFPGGFEYSTQTAAGNGTLAVSASEGYRILSAAVMKNGSAESRNVQEGAAQFETSVNADADIVLLVSFVKPGEQAEDLTNGVISTAPPTEDASAENSPSSPAEEAASESGPSSPAEEAASESGPSSPAEEAASESGPSSPAEEAASESGHSNPAEEAAAENSPSTPAEEASAESTSSSPAEAAAAESTSSESKEETASGARSADPAKESSNTSAVEDKAIAVAIEDLIGESFAIQDNVNTEGGSELEYGITGTVEGAGGVTNATVKTAHKTMKGENGAASRNIYCASFKKGFGAGAYDKISDGQWEANRLFSQIAYAIRHGATYSGETADAKYSAGSPEEDYYITQVAIWGLVYRDDTGCADALNLSGVDIDSLKGSTPTAEVLIPKIKALYADTIAASGNTSDGRIPVDYAVKEPKSIKLTPETIDGKEYYVSKLYTIVENVNGEFYTENGTFKAEAAEGAPDGTEIIQKNTTDKQEDGYGGTYSFYIRVPAENIHGTGKIDVNITVPAMDRYVALFKPTSGNGQEVFIWAGGALREQKLHAQATYDIPAGKIKIAKSSADPKVTDGNTYYSLKGAVYGIYSDKEYTKKIAELKTGENGTTSETECASGTVYIKEETAPQGYRLDPVVKEVKVSSGKTTTVKLTDEPVRIEISTTAKDQSTGTSAGAAGDAVIVDTVRYKGLIPGQTYTVTGVLVDKNTGNALTYNKASSASETGAEGEKSSSGDTNEVTAQTEFTAQSEEGTVEVTFSFDTSKLSSEIAGTDTVVFESLYHKNRLIAEHRDLEDEEQTIHWAGMKTTASGKDGETKEIEETSSVTIVDTIEYSGLIPGTKYTIVGTVMEKDSGKALKAGGKEVVVTQDLAPEKSSGTTAMRFTFDASGLSGKELVVFEKLLLKDKEILLHADLSDAGQTVKITPKEESPKESTTRSSSNSVSYSNSSSNSDSSSSASAGADGAARTGSVATGDTSGPMVVAFILMAVIAMTGIVVAAAKHREVTD